MVQTVAPKGLYSSVKDVMGQPPSFQPTRFSLTRVVLTLAKSSCSFENWGSAGEGTGASAHGAHGEGHQGRPTFPLGCFPHRRGAQSKSGSRAACPLFYRDLTDQCSPGVKGNTGWVEVVSVNLSISPLKNKAILMYAFP